MTFSFVSPVLLKRLTKLTIWISAFLDMIDSLMGRDSGFNYCVSMTDANMGIYPHCILLNFLVIELLHAVLFYLLSFSLWSTKGRKPLLAVLFHLFYPSPSHQERKNGKKLNYSPSVNSYRLIGMAPCICGQVNNSLFPLAKITDVSWTIAANLC